jgi:hypothetical protein
MAFWKHQERYSAISVIVNAWHLAHLENLARDVAEWYGIRVSRSEIIRAIVEAAMASATSDGEHVDVQTGADRRTGYSVKTQ